MECNRDDAIRSKEIAERKFKENDFAAAKKFALKSKSLFELEGIDKMILALDVHLKAQTKFGGEHDWYGILEVSTRDDDEIIRKQYKKLALQTHPDKNSFIGADGAFKLISDAWKTLSDKNKRTFYDQRRYMSFLGVFHHYNSQVNVENTSRYSMPSMYGFCRQNTTPASPANVPRHDIPTAGTFWTCCKSCRRNFQYESMYLGQFMRCPTCLEAFEGPEVPPPPTAIYPNAPKPMDTNTSMGGAAVPGKVKPRKGVASGSQNRDPMLQRCSSTKSSASAHTSHKVRQTHGTVPGSSLGSSAPATSVLKRKVAATKDKEAARKKTRKGNTKKIKSTQSSSSVHPVQDKGKGLAGKRVVLEEKEGEQNRKHVGSEEMGLWEWKKPEIRFVYTRRSREEQEPSPDEMLVPDADFCSFGDHSESSFQKDQVWATYDEEDGMPRYYALIRKVHSAHPFKVSLAFLKAVDSDEFGSSDWLSCGYSKTCGDFRPGVSKDIDQLNAFSHVVAWGKGPGRVIRIFPKKGDIWALYQNWSADWDEHTPDETMYKYELVQVLDSYIPGEGISVMPIVKVTGFVSVFKPLLDPTKSRRIPNEEMLRFSHQVPFHVLTGEEAKNSPKGCYELDPGSTPKELLHK